MTLDLGAVIRFFKAEHINQKRKYNGEPYWLHLAEVAGIVCMVDHSPMAIATSWGHDYIEDINPTNGHAVITGMFGLELADNILALSDMEEGNRAHRKAQSRRRLAGESALVQNVKCADLMSNTANIAVHDRNFAVVYLKEKKLLLNELTKASSRIRTAAWAQCDRAMHDLLPPQT